MTASQDRWRSEQSRRATKFRAIWGRVYAVNSGARIRIHTAVLNPMKKRILMRFEDFLEFWSLRRSPSQVVILAQCSDERMLSISWFLGRWRNGNDRI